MSPSPPAGLRHPALLLIIGATAGILVVPAVCNAFGIAFRPMTPVGALSVSVNGLWGNSPWGIFGHDGHTVGTQLLGMALCRVLLPAAPLIFWPIGILAPRHGKGEELRGPTLPEHGQEAYAGFQIHEHLICFRQKKAPWTFDRGLFIRIIIFYPETPAE